MGTLFGVHRYTQLSLDTTGVMKVGFTGMKYLIYNYGETPITVGVKGLSFTPLETQPLGAQKTSPGIWRILED